MGVQEDLQEAAGAAAVAASASECGQAAMVLPGGAVPVGSGSKRVRGLYAQQPQSRAWPRCAQAQRQQVPQPLKQQAVGQDTQ